MEPIQVIITTAGLDALVDAQNGATEAITIAEIGLSQQEVIAAPTLQALPGEFKRIAGIAGQTVAQNIIHLTAQDATTETYDLRSFGLYLADGTLFAAYGQADPLFRKVSIASFLVALDIAFSGVAADGLTFGDASFLYPPATEDVKGVARLATQARVDAADDSGDDGETIVTPKTLRARLAGFFGTVTASLDAFRARTIAGAGLVTGGGDLSADRVLTVSEATAAEITAGTATTKAVTPRRLGPIGLLLSQNGYLRFFGIMIVWGRYSAPANVSTAITFPLAFPTQCFVVVADGVSNLVANSTDNLPSVVPSTISQTGFSVFSADDTANAGCYIAIGC